MEIWRGREIGGGAGRPGAMSGRLESARLESGRLESGRLDSARRDTLGRGPVAWWSGRGGAGEPDPAGGERLPKGCLPWLRGATASVVSKEGLAAMMAFMTGCANVGCMVRYDAYGTMMTVRKKTPKLVPYTALLRHTSPPDSL